MPRVAYNQREIRLHRISKIALLLLLLLMTIGLAYWLYWSNRKKQDYKKDKIQVEDPVKNMGRR